MPEDGRRLKHVACNVRYNKLVVFDGNVLLITKQSVLLTASLNELQIQAYLTQPIFKTTSNKIF
jgi:hypothetical protein